MDPTKTRIWNADQLGLSAHKDDAQPAVGRAASANPAGARAVRSARHGDPHAARAAAEGFRAAATIAAASRSVAEARPRGDETLPSHRRVQADATARESADASEPRCSAPPVVRRRESPASARRPSSVPPPPPPPRRARASAPPPALSTLTARWSAPADPRGPLASTRIMPIELLLPSKTPALPQPPAARAVPRRSPTLKRVTGHVLLAALTVLAVALWKLPLIQYVRARSLPPRAPSVSSVHPVQAPREGSDGHVTSAPPLAAAAHDRPEADGRELSPAPSQSHDELRTASREAHASGMHDSLHADRREQRTGTEPPGASSRANGNAASRAEDEVSGSARVPEVGTVVSPAIAEAGSREARLRRGKGATQPRVASLQRQAVELVIGGDLAGAEQAYRRLSRDYPDQHAFPEAARILAERRRK